MKKKLLIGIGAVLAVALLAGAVFMGVRLLNSNGANGVNGLLAGLGLPGGGSAISFRIQMTPAPELPQAKADLTGQVSSIKDNSVFVSAFGEGGASGGNVVIVGKAISGGSSSDSGPSTNTDTGGSSPTPSGPMTEVVISKDTKIYRDTSMDSVPKPQPGSGSSSISVQQVLTPADVSDIVADNMVQVWGQKRGDRLIAETIVVQGIAVFKTGGGK